MIAFLGRRGPGGINAIAKLLAGFALAAASCVHAQETTAAAAADIAATYDFDPSKLSYDEQQQRAPALGALWARYDKAPTSYREALRTVLRSNGAHEILYCDGGMLLLHKSKAPDDLSLGVQSISKCSLSEIEHTPYFYTMHALALRGVDTLELQFRMLSKPEYSAFIVAHALRLGQNYAFLYPLLVQDETRYVPRLEQRLAAESDTTAQRTLLLALWYAATPQGEGALRSMAAGSSHPETIRTEARRLLDNTDLVRKWGEQDPTLKRVLETVDAKESTSEADLRKKRRTRMRAISDEALIDLDAYTALLYRALKTR